MLSAPPAAVAQADPLTDALADAIASERVLIDELTATMLRQRAAVGVDDLQTVDDSVFATHRLLLTLGEARKRRRSVNELLGLDLDLKVRDLDDALGSRMTPRLKNERDALRDAAHTLSREIDINRRVLRDALAHSETYVRAMRGIPAEVTPAYGAKGMTTYTPSHTASFSRTS